jgi:hypothetical protein
MGGDGNVGDIDCWGYSHWCVHLWKLTRLNTLNMMDAGGLAQAIECLPSKQEALSSNPPTLSTVTKMCV